VAVTAAQKLASDFAGEVSGLLALAAGPSGSATAPRDVRERLLESLFLNAVTAVEAFFERLFFAAVTGGIRTGGVRPIIRFPSVDIARRMVMPPRQNYLSWLPFRDTSDRAQAFLDRGLPFSHLDERAQLRTRLNEALTVRNVVAHRSDHAQAQFDNLVDSRYATAGEYLSAVSGASRTCEAFLQDFVRIALGLCARDDLAVAALLGDPDHLATGKKVSEGTYECVGCGVTRIVVPAGSIYSLRCSRCDPPCPSCGRVASTATFRRS